MNFSLEQLQAFVATVETGSFSAAGRRLGKAQSSVSAAVANLEIDLDNVLFTRNSRYPELTEEGKRLLAEAYLILERCEHFFGVAKSLSKGSKADWCWQSMTFIHQNGWRDCLMSLITCFLLWS